MNIKITSIELDASIQCRAALSTALVNEYAERMTEGDKFPPVVLFGGASRCWIGDGWHRVMAAKQVGASKLSAELHEGGRADALKHALSANAIHGHRRTNADKRRCVEIALREFPNLSSRAVAEMCGVSHVFVASYRQVETVTTSPVTGSDGKHYPANKPATPAEPALPQGDDRQATRDEPVPKPRGVGLHYANQAINILGKIPVKDPLRDLAFDEVAKWIEHNK